MTTEATDQTSGWRQKRRLGPLGEALDKQIKTLQREYLEDRPGARADLARLRRGLGKPPGAVPELWHLTTVNVPTSLLGSDDNELSRAEQAAHVALTLYARHQQSLTIPAHVPAMPFGRAVARLARGDRDREAAVTRRFMAVATATSMDELLTHVRGLITQLRADKRGMDYARFADDVLALLTPGRETDVRLAWGRQFYRTPADGLSSAEADDLEDDTGDSTADEGDQV